MCRLWAASAGIVVCLLLGWLPALAQPADEPVQVTSTQECAWSSGVGTCTATASDPRVTGPLIETWTWDVSSPDGSITEEPAWYMTPRDLAILIDRFQVLLERPAMITQHQGLNVTSELTVDALRDFIEATRGRGEPSRMEASPLPRKRRLDD
jgi:hypothetical protein